MSVKDKKYQMDLCQGPLLKQIIIYSVPLIFSSMLQLFFHAADLIVVGKYASHRALAAVGATSALIYLVISIFIGMSVAGNILVARYVGERNRQMTSRTVHASILLALIFGFLLSSVGVFFSRSMLKAADTPDDIIDMASCYMQIYLGGMPLVLLYNFGSAILRAAGDTKRPFYFLVIGGIINILLNLFFVIVCNMDVGGVALATVISQGVSAFFIIQVMRKMTDGCRFNWRKMRVDWKVFGEIMYLGIPTGIQSACFSLSNLIIQTAVNGFGSAVIAGNTAAVQWEHFLFIISASLGQAIISFVGQNFGGKQYKRLRKCVYYSIIFGFIFSVLAWIGIWILKVPALSLFNSNPEVIKWGVLRFKIAMPFLWSVAIMEILISAIRGLGYSIAPMMISIFGACVFRIIWIYTFFRMNKSMETLLWSYPISWVLVMIGAFFYFRFIIKQYPDKNLPRA